MAPTKSAKVEKTKQAKLNFKTAKSAASAAKNSKAASSSTKPSAPSKLRQVSQFDSSSEEEEPDIPVVLRSPKKEKVAVKKGELEDDAIESGEDAEEPRKQLNPSLKKYTKLFNESKEKGGMKEVKLIHAGKNNRIHHILRIFDNSYEYGPCVGVTRLERWERAKELGLEPPAEIHEILTTQQGVEDTSYRQCVFHDEVERNVSRSLVV